jgi:aryl-alcohol dehydrogenase-like predicted oxidoreductase
MQKEIETHRGQLEAYEALCGEIGESPANVGLAWLLHNPAVTAPIIGPRTIEQFNESLKAVDIKLSTDTLASLDQIWPGPGGEAPEAYAW